VVTLGGLVSGGVVGWLLSRLLVKILTGVVEQPPGDLAVPWAHLMSVLVIADTAMTVAAAVAAHLAAQHGVAHVREPCWGPKGSWAAQAAVAVATGHAVPVLRILVVADVLAPVRWGGGWQLLLLPWSSATVAFLCASVIKDAMARARPPESGWASPVRGFAFPPGHATTATAGCLVRALLVSRLIPMARPRGLVLGASMASALLVGVTRSTRAVTRDTSPGLEASR
jgi:hypothetical protein